METSRSRYDPWLLDPEVAFLNHGSFGACPRPVLDEQTAWRTRLEAQPVDFLERKVTAALEHARAETARFLGAGQDGFGFVTNATTAVSTVLAAVHLAPNDEVIITDHSYPAVEHAVARACAAAGARAVVARVDLPLGDEGSVAGAVAGAVTSNTRLVIVDHVTSSTGAVLPVDAIADACRSLDVPLLVDGAHAPGMLPVDLGSLEVPFWTGNFHKWLCAPKGAAALVVSPEWRERVRPLVVSQPWLTSFTDAFDWTGTFDPSAWLSVPAAIGFLASYGWDELRRRNHALAAEARRLVASAIGAEQMLEDDDHAWMTIVPLPDGAVTDRDSARAFSAALLERYKIEVPVTGWRGRAFLRLSTHLYNERDDYARLADALPRML